jgi:hypothetical protein
MLNVFDRLAKMKILAIEFRNGLRFAENSVYISDFLLYKQQGDVVDDSEDEFKRAVKPAWQERRLSRRAEAKSDSSTPSNAGAVRSWVMRSQDTSASTSTSSLSLSHARNVGTV